MLILSNCYCMDEVGREYCNIKKGDYVIIGFNKCGTVTLQDHLQKKYPNKKIHRRELIYNGIEEFERKYSECKPVIITRNKIERLWSMYNYYEWLKEIDFKEWLKQKGKIDSAGLNSPVESCDYDKFIEPFLKYEPIIYDLIMIENMNKLNENKSKPEIPPEIREYIEKWV